MASPRYTGCPGGRQLRRPRHSADPSRSTAASAVRTAATFSATSWTRTMSALAAERGADIVRVHDVAENVAAVRTAEVAVEREGSAE